MKMTQALIASVLCLCTWLAYASKVMTVHVNRTDSTFEITLPANPTTGYQWTIKQIDHSLLQLKSQQYIRPNTHLLGAGGAERFVFQLLEGKPYPKQTEIELSYARSWEPGSGDLTKIIVEFD